MYKRQEEPTAGESGGGNYTTIPIPTASPETGVTDLERAPTGTGVTLSIAALPENGLTYQAVSYTHLDVYKRQTWTVPTAARLPPATPAPATSRAAGMT